MRSHKRRRSIVFWVSSHTRVKLLATTLMAALVVFVFTNQLPADKTWTYWTLPLSGKVIMIDPGHGGVDGGARSKAGLIEKDVTLQASLYLRDYLQQAGAIVRMTRDTDTDLARPETRGFSKRKTEDLKAREALIASSGADVFLSVHLNAIPSSRWYGAQTFYTHNHKDNPSLAWLVQDEIKNNVVKTDRVAKRIRGIYLLDQAAMPTALVEVGFLSNAAEAERLADPSYQKALAAAMYRGILRFLSGEKVPAKPYGDVMLEDGSVELRPEEAETETDAHEHSSGG